MISQNPMKVVLLLVLLNLLTFTVNAEQKIKHDSFQQPLTAELAPAHQLLDQLHAYAASANWPAYFNLYLENAVFIGTDASEHWRMPEFRKYASPTRGWRYDVHHRTLNHHGNVIVFDEILYNSSYGLSRGTGTLLLTKNGWKIAQYHLSFPIPNPMAKKITAQIQAESSQKNKPVP
ncbi:nuclear transport factor 2 family protein [Shewanella gelidii]|uniref:SnoaL-like domain-containing protein n=1 Tax=Shewanella gelidii TaxID=1642821 RepID=A0A917N7Q2_9GAMM|nr:nuclear transport factor 2 family protein [Shewanella gelidii]MCL1096530.1 nuclear transport factor 2 family protein [Shewanella gelidii]GGI68134.1 hypothetical protein GCM10009332_01620 [Shewanella gelidii]